MNKGELETISRVARAAAREASSLIARGFRTHPAVERKGAVDLVTTFDRESEAHLRKVHRERARRRDGTAGSTRRSWRRSRALSLRVSALRRADALTRWRAEAPQRTAGQRDGVCVAGGGG